MPVKPANERKQELSCFGSTKEKEPVCAQMVGTGLKLLLYQHLNSSVDTDLPLPGSELFGLCSGQKFFEAFTWYTIFKKTLLSRLFVQSRTVHSGFIFLEPNDCFNSRHRIDFAFSEVFHTESAFAFSHEHVLHCERKFGNPSVLQPSHAVAVTQLPGFCPGQKKTYQTTLVCKTFKRTLYLNHVPTNPLFWNPG